MTEIKLPEELEEQAILHALGLLDPEDRQAFMVRLQGESDLLRQAAWAYHATTGTLADAVAPMTPPSTLRERLVTRVALEAVRESEQFELAANMLALGSVPTKPRDSVRERLMSRIEEHSDVQLDLSDSAHVLGATPVQKNNRMVGEGESQLLPEDISLASLLLSCWKAASNFLQTLVIRSLTSERVRYWKAKISFQQPTKGLTFIGASEGTWLGIAPGVMAKLLSYDSVSRRTTALVRIAAGTRYAPHRHAAAEESYVLEGGCNIAGHEMTVGDYHRAEAGTEHHDTSSDDGCLLLVISSPQNEMLR